MSDILYTSNYSQGIVYMCVTSLTVFLIPAGEDYDKIVFLYQLERGRAGGSYGLNVAALAGLDAAILKVAGGKSKELQLATLKSVKSRDSSFLRVWQLLEESTEISSEVLHEMIGSTFNFGSKD